MIRFANARQVANSRSAKSRRWRDQGREPQTAALVVQVSVRSMLRAVGRNSLPPNSLKLLVFLHFSAPAHKANLPHCSCPEKYFLMVRGASPLVRPSLGAAWSKSPFRRPRKKFFGPFRQEIRGFPAQYGPCFFF